LLLLLLFFPFLMSPLELPPSVDNVDFASLPWNLNLPSQHVYLHLTTTTDWSEEEKFLQELESSVFSYQDRPLPLTPATTSLNYGTTLWEGLKAYRVDDLKAVVFRPDQNYARMRAGAHEMCLPMPSKRLFLRAVQLAVQKNAHLLPPVGDGMKLYVRPMLLGSGQQLGLYPSPQVSFLVYVSPTGNHFASATAGLNLHLETRRARASRGGMGSTKCAGNYAVALKPLMDAKKHGFHDNVFLELETLPEKDGHGIEQAVLQELSAANVFVVLRTGEIVTPSLDRGTILPGVTRRSVVELIEAFADELQPFMAKSTENPDVRVTVSTRDITVGELAHATEFFATGTAAEVVPVARVATSPDDHFSSVDVTFPHGADLPGGPVTAKLLDMLREAMKGMRGADGGPCNGWLRDPLASPEDFCA
jgi:branched-chain amino acid aminotransferase